MPRQSRLKPGKEKSSGGFDRDPVRLPRRGSLLAWLTGAACIGAGAGARALLETIGSGSIPHFTTFYPLLGLIGFLCGVRIGVVATIASALLVWYYWMPPLASWAIPDRASVIALAVYSLLGSFTAWIGAWGRGLFEKVQIARIEHARVARETVHRLKNLIAVVQSLSHQTSRSAATIPEYRADLDARLIALARSQDLVLNGGSADLHVEKLVEAATGHFRDSPHFTASGEADFAIPAPVHLGLTLALGELGANSLKYGALSGVGGKVHLSWSKADGRCIILWREDAGPITGNKKGFGSRLIASALDRLEGARVDYTTDNGIQCRFDWPSET